MGLNGLEALGLTHQGLGFRAKGLKFAVLRVDASRFCGDTQGHCVKLVFSGDDHWKWQPR